MRVRFFPLMIEVEGRAVVLAHPWPMPLDESLDELYEEIAFTWVALAFDDMVVMTPITRN